MFITFNRIQQGDPNLLFNFNVTYQVVCGTRDVTNAQAGRQIAGIEAAFLHPTFNVHKEVPDIALLKLDR